MTIVSAAAAKTKFIAVLALECLARVGDFACVWAIARVIECVWAIARVVECVCMFLGNRTCDRMCVGDRTCDRMCIRE